jgi:hypothetical protein
MKTLLHQTGDEIDTCKNVATIEYDEEKGLGHDDEIVYTHISVPLPGHSIKQEYDEASADLDVEAANSVSTCNELPTAENATTPTAEMRPATIFCAICLMHYEINEQVCWSSNRECVHVFHKDCIVKWLVKLGNMKPRNERIPDSYLSRSLPYLLDCPMCRQEFLLRSEVKQSNDCTQS